jgi:C-terminal processing protease CtpA/Prc
MAANHNDRPDLGQKQRSDILRNIAKRVRKSHVNVAGVDYAEWEREIQRQEHALLAGEAEAFENGVRELLKLLKSSHTGFFHGVQNRFLPQHTINATFKAVNHGGSERWMFLDVFPEGPADKAGIRPGEFLVSVDGVDFSPSAYPPFTTGQTHQLVIGDIENTRARTVSISIPFRKGTKQRPPIVEPKVVTARMLERGIGLLRVPYFSGAAGIRFGKDLRAAIDGLKAQKCDRLIVDLRGNIGGSLGFAILASYLCPDQRPIGFSITPKSLRDGYDKEKLPRVPMPGSKASLVRTLGAFAFRDKTVALLTQGLGPQPFHGRTVVLVNEWTNSAAEMLASFAQENHLVTVVGTKTAGNVLGAQNFPVGDGYSVRIPLFGWFTWSGNCLEGTGVAPDVFQGIDSNHLSSGADQQIAAALRLVGSI